MDLIVLGSTGFTGRIASQYLAAYPKGTFRWAVAGRNRDKTEALHRELASTKNPPSEALLVDHSDAESVRAAVSRARIVISFAGPFARYGENVVAACAELGKHYLDITGEILWAERMFERYGEAARKSGAVLIPFSGFDSVPSDLGVRQALQNAAGTAPGKRITRIVSFFSARGGVNGGTYATMLDMMTNERADRLQDPTSLLPDFPEETRRKFSFALPKRPVRVENLGVPAAPFFMAPINTAVVYRSQALRLRAGEQMEPVEYLELLKPPRRLARAEAWALTLGTSALGAIGSRSAGRALLRRLGPKPGEGPSKGVRENGFFKARFEAYSGKERIAESEISYPGDPGNKATTLLICESALCLLEVAPPPGGFWTPSTALGAPLVERLRRAGVTIR